jgi:hypothetical protein
MMHKGFRWWITGAPLGLALGQRPSLAWLDSCYGVVV